MDGEKLVKQGLAHVILPTPALTFTVKNLAKETMDYNTQSGYKSDLSIPIDQVNAIGLANLEHVQVTVSITHPERKHLRIILVSPHGTRSVLAANRPKDISQAGYNPWTFMTVRNWGESPSGTWSLIIEDGRYKGKDAQGNAFQAGYLASWELILHGTCSSGDIVEKITETKGRKSLTCFHTAQTSQRVQKDLMIGFVVFMVGSVVSIISYGVYRYRLHRPVDKYFTERDDAESPEVNSARERIALIKMQSRNNDLESPSLSSAQDRLANTRSTLHGDKEDGDSGSEYDSDEDNKDAYIAAKRAQASSMNNLASLIPNSITSLLSSGSAMKRTNSVSGPLNLTINDTNKSDQTSMKQLDRSASSLSFAVNSNGGLRKGQSMGDLMKSGSTLTRSRSGIINEKKA
jgi:subtilisin-like proprotein convertase family protein